MGKMSELAYKLEQMYDGTEGLSNEELKKQMNSCRYKKCSKQAKLLLDNMPYCIKHYKEMK